MTTALDAARERFNKTAATWDSNPSRVEMARGVVEAIRNTIPLSRDMEVLDFGAGTGLLTLGLLPHVAHVTAVDASDGMLRVLDDKLKALGVDNVETRHVDIGRDPLPEAHYSLVASSMVLHHIENVPRTLLLLRRCLRPGGWIALADLDTEDGTFHTDPTGIHHKGFDRGQVGRWLESSGFVDIGFRDAFRMTRVSNGGEPRDYPLFLATGRAG